MGVHASECDKGEQVLPGERVEVFFTGMVQGVGFRFTTVNVSRGYNVTGFVRNLPGGRVQLVAEGEKEELRSFITAVEARMGGYIGDKEVRWSPATGKHVTFDVAF